MVKERSDCNNLKGIEHIPLKTSYNPWEREKIPTEKIWQTIMGNHRRNANVQHTYESTVNLK